MLSTDLAPYCEALMEQNTTEVLKTIAAFSGWVALLIQILRNRKSKPRLRVDRLKLLKNEQTNCLTITSTIRNDGNATAYHCAADFLVIDMGTMDVVPGGSGNADWILGEKPGGVLTDINSSDRVNLLVEFLIYTNAILVDDVNPHYVFPTLSASDHFLIIIMITFGNCQKMVVYVPVRVVEKINLNLSIADAFRLLEFENPKRFMRRNRIRRNKKINKIINEHDTFLERLKNKGCMEI